MTGAAKLREAVRSCQKLQVQHHSTIRIRTRPPQPLRLSSCTRLWLLYVGVQKEKRAVTIGLMLINLAPIDNSEC